MAGCGNGGGAAVARSGEKTRRAARWMEWCMGKVSSALAKIILGVVGFGCLIGLSAHVAELLFREELDVAVDHHGHGLFVVAKVDVAEALGFAFVVLALPVLTTVRRGWSSDR